MYWTIKNPVERAKAKAHYEELHAIDDDQLADPVAVGRSSTLSAKQRRIIAEYFNQQGLKRSRHVDIRVIDGKVCFVGMNSGAVYPCWIDNGSRLWKVSFLAAVRCEKALLGE